MGTTLQINDTSLKKIKHMGDQKKGRGCGSSVKLGRGWFCSQTLGWHEMHVTSFLFAAHLTKGLLFCLPRCDTSPVPYTHCLSECLTSAGLTCSSVSTGSRLAGPDLAPCHFGSSGPSAPSPGHRDTDGPQFSHLGSHLLPSTP